MGQRVLLFDRRAASRPDLSPKGRFYQAVYVAARIDLSGRPTPHCLACFILQREDWLSLLLIETSLWFVKIYESMNAFDFAGQQSAHPA